MLQSLERSAMRKIYWRLLPFAVITYLLCYIDRINVSFAALTMTGQRRNQSWQQFDIAAGDGHGQRCDRHGTGRAVQRVVTGACAAQRETREGRDRLRSHQGFEFGDRHRGDFSF